MKALLSVRSALLQALAMPGCGIELIERLRQATGGLVRVSMGSVYPALSRLEAQGLVRSRIARARGGAGRPRRYFELTLRGVGVRNAERRALAGLIRMDEHRLPAESAEKIGQRLRRCASVSASVLKLRGLVRDAEDGG